MSWIRTSVAFVFTNRANPLFRQQQEQQRVAVVARKRAFHFYSPGVAHAATLRLWDIRRSISYTCASKLRGVTYSCHMRSQCYLPPDTSERAQPNPNLTSRYSIYLPRRDERLSCHTVPFHYGCSSRNVECLFLAGPVRSTRRWLV